MTAPNDGPMRISSHSPFCVDVPNGPCLMVTWLNMKPVASVRDTQLPAKDIQFVSGGGRLNAIVKDGMVTRLNYKDENSTQPSSIDLIDSKTNKIISHAGGEVKVDRLSGEVLSSYPSLLGVPPLERPPQSS